MSAPVINRFCPQRVRLSRRPGFRLQEQHPGAIVVARPTRFGNPFTIGQVLLDQRSINVQDAQALCVTRFRLWLAGDAQGDRDVAAALAGQLTARRRTWILDHLTDLAGRPLACWCPLPVFDEPDQCHAAHLINLANNTNYQGGNQDGLATQGSLPR
jgi:hypothetical protein